MGPSPLARRAHDCPRCGRIVGPIHMRTEHVKHLGWAPCQVVSYVNWCGHAQEIIPLPLPNGRVDCWVLWAITR